LVKVWGCRDVDAINEIYCVPTHFHPGYRRQFWGYRRTLGSAGRRPQNSLGWCALIVKAGENTG